MLGMSNARGGAKSAGLQEVRTLPMPKSPLRAGAPFKLEPAFAIADRFLILGTTAEAVRKAASAARGPAQGIGASLREAIGAAPAGTFAIGVADGAAQARRWEELVSMAASRSGAAAPKDLLGADSGSARDTVVRGRADGASLVLECRSAGTPALLTTSVATAGVVSAIAIPNLLSARLSANERAAQATLRSLGSAQAQLQAMGAIDEDRDGIGEYGYVA
jgi:hypothetical protein